MTQRWLPGQVPLSEDEALELKKVRQTGSEQDWLMNESATDREASDTDTAGDSPHFSQCQTLQICLVSWCIIVLSSASFTFRSFPPDMPNTTGQQFAEAISEYM